MFNLFSYDLCIQNQIDLVNNIVYSNYLLRPVRSYSNTVCAVSYLAEMKSISSDAALPFSSEILEEV